MTEAWVISFALILVRVATFWTLIPVWSALKPPKMVKLGLVVSLTVFWFFGLTEPVASARLWATGSLHWAFLVLLVGREILLGGMLAMAFHIFFVPMQIAGAYIGQELGLSIATLTDTTSGAVNNIVATLMQVIAIVLFFVLDLHHYLIWCLHSSFELLPAGNGWRFESVGGLIHGFADITEQGLAICTPVALVAFVALIALLVLARAAPALNLFSVGMPVRLLVGLAAILVFLPGLMVNCQNQFETGIRFVENLLSAL